jgi:hypothetical protein
MGPGTLSPDSRRAEGKNPNPTITFLFSSATSADRCIFGNPQRGIARRDIEDAEHPEETWGVDRTESDGEDLDPLEGDVPIYVAPPRSIPGTVPGKASIRASISEWTDDDDSDNDVRIIEVYNPLPVSYSFPVTGTSADPGVQATDDEPSNASAPSPTAPGKSRGKKRVAVRKAPVGTKRQKVGTTGPRNPKTPKRRPTAQG